MVQVCTHRKGFETGDRQCDLSLGTRREAWQDQLTASGIPPVLCFEIKENPSFISLKTGFPFKFQKASWI